MNTKTDFRHMITPERVTKVHDYAFEVVIIFESLGQLQSMKFYKNDPEDMDFVNSVTGLNDKKPFFSVNASKAHPGMFRLVQWHGTHPNVTIETLKDDISFGSATILHDKMKDAFNRGMKLESIKSKYL